MNRLAGLFAPDIREGNELMYEFTEPFVVDDSAFRRAFPDASSTSLDQYLEMKVEQDTNVNKTGPVNSACANFPSTATVIFPTTADTGGTTGTLEQLKAKRSDWTSGIPVGTPVGTPAKNSVAPNTPLTFRITYLVKDENGAQGKKSTATFTWEARNN
jgi:hypothetical protein